METWRQPTPSGFCKVAAVTWLAYDIVITSNDEIIYVWHQPRGFMTYLYFMTRYGTVPIVVFSVIMNLVSNVSDTGCNILSWVEAVGTFYIFLSVQAILQYRVYIMYSKSRLILFVNLALLVVEFIVGLALAILFLPTNQTLLPSDTIQGSCFDITSSRAVISLSVPCVVYECWLLALCLRQAQRDYASRKRFDPTSIIFRLSRDSLMYFLMIIIAIVSMMVVMLLEPASPGNSMISFTHVAECIAGYRLILRTRQAAMSSPKDSRGRTTMTTMAFDIRQPPTGEESWELREGSSNQSSRPAVASEEHRN